MRRRSTRITRQSTSAPAKDAAGRDLKISIEEKENKVARSSRSRGATAKKRTAQPESDASDSDGEEFVGPDTITGEARVKRRKIVTRLGEKNATRELHARLFGGPDSGLKYSMSTTPCIDLSTRAHELIYHRPLLLDRREARASLLKWFDGVSTARNMPWRKAWIDPAEDATEGDLRQRLERRAYEVWVSEIMLQQTRVAVVIDYWNRWMARWPSIQDLAAAEPDEVLAAWRGLGYYSRATRIHKAAMSVCSDKRMMGLLPSEVEDLVEKVPGVGRYTAGAISAIVFGKAAPMVDGNVLRVLSRVMGVLGDVKADKGVIDVLWEAADRLVKAVARDRPGDDTDDAPGEECEGDTKGQPSDRPGRWGQALMELGSTVCLPKPNCADCPITSSCRAYGEGLQLAAKKGTAPEPIDHSIATDIEDACTFCKPFSGYADDDDGEQDTKMVMSSKQQKPKAKTQTTLQSFAFTQTPASASAPAATKSKEIPRQEIITLSPAAMEVIANHARKFPVKRVKKAIREEETLVCALRRNDGRYLIHRRPEKGLLAGLWELPSYVLRDGRTSTATTRRADAEKYVIDLVNTGRSKRVRVRHIGGLGSVPWLFSHLKLTMHVHLFELDSDVDFDKELGNDRSGGMQGRWAEAAAIDEESMGTGMRKCWALVKETDGG